MTRLTIPAIYWEDYSERHPVERPSQMAIEVRRAGNRVTIEANAEQLECLHGDAAFYAEGNTDGTWPAVIRGAKRVVDLCRAIKDMEPARGERTGTDKAMRNEAGSYSKTPPRS